jgi:hypothetical protein
MTELETKNTTRILITINNIIHKFIAIFFLLMLKLFKDYLILIINYFDQLIIDNQNYNRNQN